jgi:hypothetical protein
MTIEQSVSVRMLRAQRVVHARAWRSTRDSFGHSLLRESLLREGPKPNYRHDVIEGRAQDFRCGRTHGHKRFPRHDLRKDCRPLMIVR